MKTHVNIKHRAESFTDDPIDKAYAQVILEMARSIARANVGGFGYTIADDAEPVEFVFDTNWGSIRIGFEATKIPV